MTQSYGNLKVKPSLNDGRLDPFKKEGYVIIADCLSPAECDQALEKLEKIYSQQAQEFGLERLEKIKELDVARAPLLADEFFLKKCALNEKVLAFVEQAIEGAFQLHLQNGIINRPQKVHHQTHWHRDLPYQNWVASKPLAVSVLMCLTDFKVENGATQLVPGSHQIESLPADDYIEKNKISMKIPKGSALVFNSMVMHAAGVNQSNQVRVGINHVYSIPLIKQQINWVQEIKRIYPHLNSKEQEILGLKYESPRSVQEWRTERYSRSQA